VITLEEEVLEEFPDEKLLLVSNRLWFAEMANFKVAQVVSEDMSWHQQQKMFKEAKYYL